SVGANEFGGMLVAAVLDHLGRADQRRDVAGEGGRRVAARLLPALLSGGRSFPYEITAGPQDRDVRVKVSQRAGAPEPPRQHDWEGDFIELYAGPVGTTVDPEILVEAAILALGDSEINQGAQRGGVIADGEQSGGAVHHVPGPHQVVSPQIVVALVFAPRNAHAGNHGAGIDLVLVGEQEIYASLEQGGILFGQLLDVGEAFAGALPLIEERFQRRLERNTQGLCYGRGSAVRSVAESNPHREFVAPGQVNLAGERNIAVACVVIVPVHLEVVGEIGPAVIDSDVATGEPHERERNTGDGEIDVATVGHQQFAASGLGDY